MKPRAFPFQRQAETRRKAERSKPVKKQRRRDRTLQLIETIASFVPKKKSDCTAETTIENQAAGLAMETRWSMLPKVAVSLSQEGDDACRRDDGCAYTTLLRTICSLEKDAFGKPVQKCEKTEQLLRKCAGRPAEVVDSKVEETEEAASTSHSPFSLDYESGTGRTFATPYRRHERKYGPSENAASAEYPVQKPFEGSFEEFVQQVFSVPLESLEVEKVVPSTPAPGAAEHMFGWFKRGPFGRIQQPPVNDASSDQAKAKHDIAKLYESLARDVQEV